MEPYAPLRSRYCDYGCSACAQACRSNAIPSLDLTKSRAAVIDEVRCWRWAQGVPVETGAAIRVFR